MKDSFSINTRRYAMRKRKWMKAGACALSAVLIMGLYAGPAFAEWIGTGSARAYIINGQVQTGWQQIDGKWYYFNPATIGITGWSSQGLTWNFDIQKNQGIPQGAMYKNQRTPDGYLVDEQGAWIQ